MKTYYLKNKNNLVNDTRLSTKSKLLMYINEKCIYSLEKAIEQEDIRRISNIVDDFSMEIYKTTGVWYNTFDYYHEYGDNLNGYVSLLIYRVNKALS